MATALAPSEQLGTIETNIPARLDRLPWSRWRWRIVIGLGTVWILDVLAVWIVGSIAGAISAKGSGINISAGEIAGWAASLYVAGACVGALLFGRLTDLFGRRRLFMITLGVYLAATIATAFAPAALFFFVCRLVKNGHRRRVRPAAGWVEQVGPESRRLHLQTRVLSAATRGPATAIGETISAASGRLQRGGAA